MNSDPTFEVAASEDGLMDRRIIRVELPQEHAGVTAALRKALMAVPDGKCDEYLDELIRRLG